MRYPASEKLEIIRIVEQSHLPAMLTLDKLGVARRTFYRWYDRYLDGGPEALADKPSTLSRVWNRIPDAIHDQIIELALEQSELSPHERDTRLVMRPLRNTERVLNNVGVERLLEKERELGFVDKGYPQFD